jgi:uncharacterized membrane protein YkvA (DUF1232 family)
MLKALSSQLQELAKSTDNDFRATIKKHMDGKVTEEQISTLKEFIFLLPPTLKILNSYWDDPRTPPDVKKLSGLLIAYIIRRDDLLSDEHLGFFGYLDDSYIVVSAFLRIQEMYLRDWQDKSPEERELTERARKLIVAPRIVIPEETTGIDEVMELYVRGHITSFEDYLTSRKKASS